MSSQPTFSRPQSIDIDRNQQFRYNPNESSTDLTPSTSSLPNILPELSKIVRKLLPHELLMNTHVRNVDYFEHGCERLSGTLYMTVFRLVFAPDNEIETNQFISSGNRYIGEYDIPLTSIYKIIVAPVDSRSGFRSFRNENLSQSETRAFTIITRDFRNITFSKSSVRKPQSPMSKPEVSSTKMETYIDALKVHSRCRDKKQLYPYIATKRSTISGQSPTTPDSCTISPLIFLSTRRTSDDDIADFCLSNDERIKSYLTNQDWNDELQDANENRWTVDPNRFDKSCIVRDEGPFVRIASPNGDETFKDLIWHWTHTAEIEIDGQEKQTQSMLVTVPGVVDLTITADAARRTPLESNLTYTPHSVYEHQFQRYNISKFPCNLKRLEINFEKLVEICVTVPEEDDDKWLTKLNTSKWLRYVSKALRGAASLAKLLNYKNIQLCGSDIDNSCLMSSLIQILLRPKCRTIKGFCELIVREWLNRGHPFHERFGRVISDSDRLSAQEGPIFLLFFDCVHQLINQNPFSFEFTDYFLIVLYHSACYCYHHTFAFNSVVERVNILTNCPKNLLILSSFDFSLYLYPDVYHLLKNYASVFTVQKIPPPPPPPPAPAPSSSRPQSKKMSQIHELLNKSFAAPRPVKPTNPTPEPVKPVNPIPEPAKPTNPVVDTPPPITESLPINPEQFEYDNIEVPQKFPGDFHVDWRLFNLVLWSKCYCRYDQNYIPDLLEQQLLSEIGSLIERYENTRKKSEEHVTADAYHSINYANSWYPQTLDTHV